MEVKYAYNDHLVDEYKQFFPERELIQQGYTNKFLLDVVRCIVKTLFRLSTLAFMDETEHTNRILESKLDRCLKELQYFMLKQESGKTNNVKHEAKANIIEILNILWNHTNSVAKANREKGIIASHPGHICERLATIISNIKANNYRRVLWPPSRLTFAERMYRQPTEYEQNVQRFSEMHTLSRLPTMRDLAPEFRANIESYLAPAGYEHSGTKRYNTHLEKRESMRRLASTLGKRTSNKQSSKKSNKTRKTK